MTQPAFWGEALRERGVILDWPEGEKVPRWAVAVDAPLPTVAPVEPPEALARNDGEVWIGGQRVRPNPPATDAEPAADAEPL